MGKPVRTLVAFTDSKHVSSIPELVLYFNTDTKKLCFNHNGFIYIVPTYLLEQPQTPGV